ncbi:MAG: PAS domain-containing protein [Lysobacteraceae bacterium]|nr:MAG: PAS domain-containing protein [Xanthomonadaceae bacterium]
MPDSAARFRRTLGLTALSVSMVLLIVVAPFLLVRTAHRESIAAAAAVNHTYAVESTAHALMYALRNRESAALAHAFGHDSAAIQARLAQSRGEIPEKLAQLTMLTRDHPQQQVRIGHLAAQAEARGQVIDEILARPSGTASSQQVDFLLTRNQLRQVANEIVDAEQVLLRQRQAEAERLDRRSNALTSAAMVGQLLLLGVLGFLLARVMGSRRWAELAAMHSSARAQAVLQTVREPVAVVDRALGVVMHNPAFAEVFGIEGSAVGKALDTIGDGAWSGLDTRQRLADVLGRDRELWDHELPFRDRAGVERVLMVNARRMALPDRDDEVALVTANDVTGQKAAEQKVRELNRQLQGKVDQVSEVNRELEAFSYSVSHDLRAPLRHIGGFADKLGRHLGEGKDEKTIHYLATITNSARRMSQLIDDLLVYSRLGRSALRLQPVDMQSVVDETRALLDANNASENPGHRIDWRIAPLPIVVGDENMLRQVWLNLLSNAVKYSARSEPALIDVGFRRLDGGEYEFNVADNGVGFDMAYAGKLFGVFQRLHSVSEFEGTGIGLASVRRVLARHGGHISAEASPDAGARFAFTLPIPGDTTPQDLQ